MERQPLDRETYDSARRVGTRRHREHLTANERDASKVLCALLLCLNAIYILLLFGVEQLHAVAIALALLAAVVGALLLLSLKSDGVTERLLFLADPGPRVEAPRARRLAAILVVMLTLAAMVLAAIPLVDRLTYPMWNIALAALTFGSYPLLELKLTHATEIAPPLTPVPTKTSYTSRQLPRIHKAIFITLGLVVFVAGTLLLEFVPSFSTPAPLTDAAGWTGDSLRGLAIPTIPGGLRDALILPRWLAASLAASINIAFYAAVFRSVKVTPAPDSPLAGGPGSGRSPNNLVSYLAGATLVAGIVIFVIASS